MFITGKCRICGCPVGLEASDLGKMRPPTACGRCSAEARNLRDVFRELSGLELGDLTAPRPK